MNDFFNEFRPITEKEWKQKVLVELKGQDYTEALCTNSEEGFQIKPLYTYKDVEKRTSVKNQSDWNIISYFTPTHHLPYDLLDGIVLTEENSSQFLPATNDLIFLKSNKTSQLKALNKNTYRLQDFIGEMIFSGKKLNQDFIKNIQNSSIDKAFKNSLCINLSPYHNAGASITQQLAVMLSIGQAYVEIFSNKKILQNTLLFVALGSDFFGEIAKLRAARILWANYCAVYELDDKLEILAESSLRNKSAMDKYNNIIRSSFEGVSAIIGGANHILLNPYDEIFKKKRDISHELSFKQQLIMKEEAMLNQFSDPGSGNYFIESLTRQLAEQAWYLFKEWEKQGGFIACLEKGLIQNAILKQAKEEQNSFNIKEKKLIGVNIYPSNQEKIKLNEIERKKAHQQKVDFKTIQTKRLAEEIEKNSVLNEC